MVLYGVMWTGGIEEPDYFFTFDHDKALKEFKSYAQKRDKEFHTVELIAIDGEAQQTRLRHVSPNMDEIEAG